MYREYRDHNNRLHRALGPAIDAPDRKEYWSEGRRHRDDGPAVLTKHGTRLFYWRGTLVPPEAILEPRTKPPKEILKIENVEVRRAWMEAYGYEEFFQHLKPKVLDRNDAKDLTLVLLKMENDEDLVMVRVKNSTPEGLWKDGSVCLDCNGVGAKDSEAKDVGVFCTSCAGTGKVGMTFHPELKNGKPWYKYYYLRVPPMMKNAEEAVAWTFGMEKGEYRPSVET